MKEYLKFKNMTLKQREQVMEKRGFNVEKVRAEGLKIDEFQIKIHEFLNTRETATVQMAAICIIIDDMLDIIEQRASHSNEYSDALEKTIEIFKGRLNIIQQVNNRKM